MIEDLGAILSAVFDIFSTELTLYGFSFSWWNVFAFTAVAGIILYFVFGVIDND